MVNEQAIDTRSLHFENVLFYSVTYGLSFIVKPGW